MNFTRMVANSVQSLDELIYKNEKITVSFSRCNIGAWYGYTHTITIAQPGEPSHVELYTNYRLDGKRSLGHFKIGIPGTSNENWKSSVEREWNFGELTFIDNITLRNNGMFEVFIGNKVNQRFVESCTETEFPGDSFLKDFPEICEYLKSTKLPQKIAQICEKLEALRQGQASEVSIDEETENELRLLEGFLGSLQIIFKSDVNRSQRLEESQSTYGYGTYGDDER